MDTLLALLVHERDRQAVRAAVPDWVTVDFIARAAELGQRRPGGEPTAVLAELVDADGASPTRAIDAFRRHTSSVPVGAYIPLVPEMIREVVHLAARGLVTDVIIRGVDDLRVRLRHLMRHTPARNETAALKHLWRRWTPPELRDIVAACIAASDGPASVADVARQLNRSPRTLTRQLVVAGLPPPHRVLRWCRLLRAAHRVWRPGANVKQIAEALGYPSAHALAQRLRRHTGLTLTELRTGGFGGLAAYVQARLLAARTRALLRGRRGAAR